VLRYWCVDVLMCWGIDVLMCWCVDVLMCWCADVLMCWCWCVDVLMCWCVDVLMCWRVDVSMGSCVKCVNDCVNMLICWCVDVLMCWCVADCVNVLMTVWMCWCVSTRKKNRYSIFWWVIASNFGLNKKNSSRLFFKISPFGVAFESGVFSRLTWIHAKLFVFLISKIDQKYFHETNSIVNIHFFGISFFFVKFELISKDQIRVFFEKCQSLKDLSSFEKSVVGNIFGKSVFFR